VRQQNPPRSRAELFTEVDYDGAQGRRRHLATRLPTNRLSQSVAYMRTGNVFAEHDVDPTTAGRRTVLSSGADGVR